MSHIKHLLNNIFFFIGSTHSSITSLLYGRLLNWRHFVERVFYRDKCIKWITWNTITCFPSTFYASTYKIKCLRVIHCHLIALFGTQQVSSFVRTYNCYNVSHVVSGKNWLWRGSVQYFWNNFLVLNLSQIIFFQFVNITELRQAYCQTFSHHVIEYMHFKIVKLEEHPQHLIFYILTNR